MSFFLGGIVLGFVGTSAALWARDYRCAKRDADAAEAAFWESHRRTCEFLKTVEPTYIKRSDG